MSEFIVVSDSELQGAFGCHISKDADGKTMLDPLNAKALLEYLAQFDRVHVDRNLTIWLVNERGDHAV